VLLQVQDGFASGSGLVEQPRVEKSVSPKSHPRSGELVQALVAPQHAAGVQLGCHDGVEAIEKKLDGLVVEVGGQVAGSRVRAVPRLLEPITFLGGVVACSNAFLKSCNLLLDDGFISIVFI